MNKHVSLFEPVKTGIQLKIMKNMTHQHPRFMFSVNGGDLQTTKVALVAPILVLLTPAALYWYVARSFFSEDLLASGADLYGLILIVILSILVVFRLFFSLQKGDYTRFQISIDLERMMISAFDRKTGLKLWEEQYDPLKLYFSKIQIIIQDESFFYPALVYGSEQYDLVEEVVPYPEHLLLGFGEREELESVVAQLSGEEYSSFA
mgnify:CR=1 FL=1